MTNLSQNAGKLPLEGWLVWTQTHRLVQAFERAGVPLRFVGGAVRDALLGRDVKDVDAATPCPPQKVMSLLEAAQIKVVPTGLSHGTVTAVIDGLPFEITTLRRDIKTYGRHAEVFFTDRWEEDAARRDFTLNALYCDAHGRIFDYVDGLTDLRTGHIRFIGDASQRIAEDGLRILRFFRFSAHYGQDEVDRDGLAACHQRREMLDTLSGERIQQEMMKLLRAERAAEMLELMQHAEALAGLIPGMLDTTTLRALPRVALMADISVDPLVALALLLRSQPNPQAEAGLASIIQRWKLSNREANLLTHYVTGSSLDAELSDAEQKKRLRYQGSEIFSGQLVVSWCERLVEVPAKAQLLSVGYRAMLSLARHWQVPVFPLNGEDLKQRGIASGPLMGEWLKRLEEWWERESYQPTKEALLRYFEEQR